MTCVKEDGSLECPESQPVERTSANENPEHTLKDYTAHILNKHFSDGEKEQETIIKVEDAEGKGNNDVTMTQEYRNLLGVYREHDELPDSESEASEPNGNPIINISDDEQSNDSDIVIERVVPADDDDIVEDDPKTRRFGVVVRGELTLDDLPPVERLTISVPADHLEHIGTVESFVDRLVVVESAPGHAVLNLDTVLFLEDGRAVGQVFDVIGPVRQPYYVLRFNNPKEIADEHLERGVPLYCAPSHSDYTFFVFERDILNMMNTKGSDASWEHDIEPPEHEVDYSDDEQEQAARRARRHAKRLHNGVPVTAPSDDQNLSHQELQQPEPSSTDLSQHLAKPEKAQQKQAFNPVDVDRKRPVQSAPALTASVPRHRFRGRPVANQIASVSSISFREPTRPVIRAVSGLNNQVRRDRAYGGSFRSRSFSSVEGPPRLPSRLPITLPNETAVPRPPPLMLYNPHVPPPPIPPRNYNPWAYPSMSQINIPPPPAPHFRPVVPPPAATAVIIPASSVNAGYSLPFQSSTTLQAAYTLPSAAFAPAASTFSVSPTQHATQSQPLTIIAYPVPSQPMLQSQPPPLNIAYCAAPGGM